MTDPVTASVGVPSQMPPPIPRPPFYALVYRTSDGYGIWSLGFTSTSRAWVEDMQKRHPGSVLVTVPGEE